MRLPSELDVRVIAHFNLLCRLVKSFNCSISVVVFVLLVSNGLPCIKLIPLPLFAVLPLG